MKFLSLIGFFCLLNFVSVEKSLAKVVVGKVNIQKILVSVNESKKIRKKLKATFEKKKGVLKKEEEKIVKMQDDLKKQSSVMNAKARRKREMKIQESFMKLQQKTVEYQKEIEKMENKFKRPMLEKIRKIVDEVSKKSNVDFTYEESGAAIVYSKESKDLTNEIIKIYNKRHK